MQIGQYALIQDLYNTLPLSNVTMPDDNITFPTWTFYRNPYDVGDGPVRSAVFPSVTDSCIGNMLYQRCLDATQIGLYSINVTCRADGTWAVPVDYFRNSTTNKDIDYDGELVTSYPDTSCINLFNLGSTNVNTGGPYYQSGASLRTPEWNASNFLCVPSADYQWVSGMYEPTASD
jgi:hypothetical protein